VQDNDWHPGITMHRLRVGGGIAGFIFTAGYLLIALYPCVSVISGACGRRGSAGRGSASHAVAEQGARRTFVEI